MKKILHTIYTCLLWMGFVGFALSGCKDDELVKNNGEVVEGVPITVTFNLGGTPAADVTVDTRASGSDLSEISELVIFIFHKDGSLEDVVTNYHGITTLEVVTDNVDKNKNRLYNVKFNTTSGEKKLLAVANVAEGGYWERVIDLLTVAYQKKYSFGKVKSEIVSLREDLTDGVQPFHITSSSQMFISGWNEGVVFGTDNSVTDYGTYGGDASNQVVVKMNRAMANITFNIEANPTDAQGTFTPTSYRVYNIPTKSYMTNDLQGSTSYALTTDVKDVTYIHTASENIGTAQGDNYTFNFYMPENVQKLGTSGTYNERDMWKVEKEDTSVSGALPENKKWKHAPQNSTFVVISGTYEGYATIYDNNTSVNQPVTANVEYTIHLGDFGNSNDANRNFADFSVMRNNSYTYNVEVRGVDNIIVEVIKKEEKQSGAEGSVYDNGQAQYNYSLDAHYEQVYLEYNLSEIANSLGQGLSGKELDNAIANQLILIIQSEMMSHLPNKRAEISPYQIYADAVRDNNDPDEAKTAVLAGAGSGTTPTKGFDYKWIEFMPQINENTIAQYPGVSSWARENLTDMANKNFYEGNATDNAKYLMDVYDVIVEMGKKIKELYKSTDKTLSVDTGEYPKNVGEIMVANKDNDYVARFTAFVNEYYYLRHPLTGAKITSWSKVTNKMPREMIIAMSTETSTDGNSSYSKIHSYISQLSMEAFYNDNATSLDAFGIETYNETPLYLFKTDDLEPISESGLIDDDGRENQKILIGASSTPVWSKYITASGNGWTSSVGTDHSKHKLEHAYAIQVAYSACMSRNRDLNGNGNIDENEIRWFLPSLNEYIRMGIGAKAISNAAQLFIGDKITMTKNDYPSDKISDGSLYYTSSTSGKRVYWAIEKGSYGPVGGSYDSSKALPIRCIRNLPASGGGASTDISSIDGVKSDATYKKHDASGSTPIVLEFKDRLVASLYRQRVQGSLDIHNEDGDANKFYDGIFVAKDFITSYSDGNENKEIVLGDIIGYDGTVNWEIKNEWGWTVEYKSYKNNGTMTNPCASYDEGGYDWRVPNLVELSAMNAAGLLVHSGSDVACCTQFSNQKVRYGFAYSTLIYCLGANVDQISTKVSIRCVRDVPAGHFDN